MHLPPPQWIKPGALTQSQSYPNDALGEAIGKKPKKQPNGKGGGRWVGKSQFYEGSSGVVKVDSCCAKVSPAALKGNLVEVTASSICMSGTTSMNTIYISGSGLYLCPKGKKVWEQLM